MTTTPTIEHQIRTIVRDAIVEREYGEPLLPLDNMDRMVRGLFALVQQAATGMPVFQVETRLAAAGDSVVVRARIARPRPSPRGLLSDFERRTAVDFEVDLVVDGKAFEGSITMHDPYFGGASPSGKWAPCRSSTLAGVDNGERWLHGGLMEGLRYARNQGWRRGEGADSSTSPGVRADAVERGLILALSGRHWPGDDRWYHNGIHRELALELRL